MLRRPLLIGSLACMAGAHADANADNRADAAANDAAAALLRTGGLVLAMRHALAPGTFDPPQFKLGDCSTQRNLSDEGRAQARRIGQWLASRQLQPAAVRSSPWCRCMETATLAFGKADQWAALGSPRGASEGTNAESLQALTQAVEAASRVPGRFDVWVTHQFVLNDVVGVSTSAGEGLLLRAGPDRTLRVLTRLLVA